LSHAEPFGVGALLRARGSPRAFPLAAWQKRRTSPALHGRAWLVAAGSSVVLAALRERLTRTSDGPTRPRQRSGSTAIKDTSRRATYLSVRGAGEGADDCHGNSSVWIATARCGLDGADQAGGLARRTRRAAAQRRTRAGRLFCFAMQKAPGRRRKIAGGSALRGSEGLQPFTLWPDQAMEEAAGRGDGRHAPAPPWRGSRAATHRPARATRMGEDLIQLLPAHAQPLRRVPLGNGGAEELGLERDEIAHKASLAAIGANVQGE
jgi:hypothetical protein